MTDGWKSAERSQDIRAVMLRLSDLFSPSFGGQVIFRLFGPYEGVPNLLFTVLPFLYLFLIWQHEHLTSHFACRISLKDLEILGQSTTFMGWG